MADNTDSDGNAGWMIGAGILIFGKEYSALGTKIRVDVYLSAAIITLVHLRGYGMGINKYTLTIGTNNRIVRIFRVTFRTEFHFYNLT